MSWRNIYNDFCATCIAGQCDLLKGDNNIRRRVSSHNSKNKLFEPAIDKMKVVVSIVFEHALISDLLGIIYFLIR